MSEQAKDNIQDSESQAEPTYYQQGEKIINEVLQEGKKAVNDATDFLSGMADPEPAEGTETEEFNMRTYGRKFASDVKESIADAADIFSKSLVGDKSTPRTEEESAKSEGVTLENISEVTRRSLAGTADAVSVAVRGYGKTPKCKNPNCTCADCQCAEGACGCGTEEEATGKASKCKNPKCTCADCECAEGSCQCGVEK